VLQSSEDDWGFAPKAGVVTLLAVWFLSTLVSAGCRESGWLAGSLSKPFTGRFLVWSHRSHSASAP